MAKNAIQFTLFQVPQLFKKKPFEQREWFPSYEQRERQALSLEIVLI